MKCWWTQQGVQIIRAVSSLRAEWTAGNRVAYRGLRRLRQIPPRAGSTGPWEDLLVCSVLPPLWELGFLIHIQEALGEQRSRPDDRKGREMAVMGFT